MIATLAGVMSSRREEKYVISDSLRLSNSTQWSGYDWGTILWFQPNHPTDAMITTSDSDRLGNSNQAISLRHLFITNSYLSASHNFPKYNANARDAIDFRNTRFFSVEDVTIIGFVNGVGIRAGYLKTAGYSFFNRIVSVHIKNCYRSIQLDKGASALQIIGGELGNDESYAQCPSDTCNKMKDYEVYIDQAAAVSILGTTLEGYPTEAHIYDAGSGTTILGVYTESRSGVTPMVKRPQLTPFANGLLFGALRGLSAVETRRQGCPHGKRCSQLWLYDAVGLPYSRAASPPGTYP